MQFREVARASWRNRWRPPAGRHPFPSRQYEERGTDPFAVLDMLTPEDTRDPDDFPAVRLHVGREVVAVTTFHSAKGLEWDHVCIPQIAPGGEPPSPAHGIRQWRCAGTSWASTRVLPEPPLPSAEDPAGAIFKELDAAEKTEERTRLFYVAFTRARESVTLVVPPGEGDPAALGSAVRATLIDSGSGWDGLREIVAAGAIDVPSKPGVRRRPPVRVRDVSAAWRDAWGWRIANPSSFGDVLGREERERIVEAARARGELVRSEAQPPAFPDLPELGKPQESLVGDMVHGWLEEWGLEGEARVEAAERYLADAWSLGGDELAPPRRWLAEWLVALSEVLPTLEPFASDAADATLRFEWPVVATEGDHLIVGRMDLALERGDEVGVSDFKAGGKTPSVVGDVPREYLLQLEAYRRAVLAAGRAAGMTSLLYPRETASFVFP